ncbi:MAG: hypothetical protein JXQ96_13380 [Cyclobacteriaceae bacterium]
MTDQQLHTGTKAGTIGGSVMGLVGSIDSTDLVRTVVLAAVGAIVSFTVSMLLKWFARAWRRHRSH